MKKNCCFKLVIAILLCMQAGTAMVLQADMTFETGKGDVVVRGSFEGSCTGCKIEHGYLICTCKDAQGHRSVDGARKKLSDCPNRKFKNNNGNLECEN